MVWMRRRLRPSNIYKVGGGNDFLKEAVYHQLCYDVEETFELDLNRLLADYLHVSEELKGRLSGFRRRMANDGLVLENDGDGYVRTLRLLIGMGVLPLASSRKGDVVNIRQDFERVLEMLMQMGERQPKTEYKNVVNSYRDYFYGDEVLETRIGMICAAHTSLRKCCSAGRCSSHWMASGRRMRGKVRCSGSLRNWRIHIISTVIRWTTGTR